MNSIKRRPASRVKWGFDFGRLSECQFNLARALTLGLADDDGYIVAKLCDQLKHLCFTYTPELTPRRPVPLSEPSPSARTWTGRACWRCSIVTGGPWRTTTSASLHRQRLAATLRVGGAGEPSRLHFRGRLESGESDPWLRGGVERPLPISESIYPPMKCFHLSRAIRPVDNCNHAAKCLLPAARSVRGACVAGIRGWGIH